MQQKDPYILAFDRGTIIIKSSALLNQSLMPGVVWDERIGGWRAAAHRFHDLQAAILGSMRHQRVAPERTTDPWQTIELRPYQYAALAAWTANNERGVVVLPTGAGKTRLALAAAAACQVPTLFLVPTRVLLWQWVAQIREVYRGPIGIYGDSELTLYPVTVATYASAWRHIESIGQKFYLLVVDESHHFGDAMQDEILEMCTAPARLGLTATPVSDPRVIDCVSDLIGPVVHMQSITDLAGKYLAEFENYVWLLPLSAGERRSYERDMAGFRRFLQVIDRRTYKPSWPEIMREANKSTQWQAAMAGFRRARALLALTEAKCSAVIELLNRHISSRVLIFTADTATAYRLSRMLLIPAVTADIKRAERDQVIARFREGVVSALISCRVLNEGIDVPDADVAIILGGMAGRREHVQRVGRVLRPSEGKVAMIYELVADGTLEVRQASRRRAGLSDGSP